MSALDLPIDYAQADRRTRRLAREQYVREQSGKCYYCATDLAGAPAARVRALSIDKSLFPPGFFQWPVHLHHCHKTGMTLGAVHARCNAALWQHHGE